MEQESSPVAMPCPFAAPLQLYEKFGNDFVIGGSGVPLGDFSRQSSKQFIIALMTVMMIQRSWRNPSEADTARFP